MIRATGAKLRMLASLSSSFFDLLLLLLLLLLLGSLGRSLRWSGRWLGDECGDEDEGISLFVQSAALARASRKPQ